MGENKVTRCANPDCTCHTQNAAKFCSESCAHREGSGAEKCRCGHAGCASADYVRYRIGSARYEAERADRLAGRSSTTRQNADERRADAPVTGFSRSHSDR
jgi:hypothetical protein